MVGATEEDAEIETDGEYQKCSSFLVSCGWQTTGGTPYEWRKEKVNYVLQLQVMYRQHVADWDFEEQQPKLW